ncbi:MAG: polyketide cyclase [Rhodanobacteraceae bacterium]|nr:polyketide cyclase [Rhodanobacteraceae bacterium]
MASDKTLRTERMLPYSAESIYAAFSSAETLASWWGPKGFTNSFDTFEFVPGGKWIFKMHSSDGQSFSNISYFAALSPSKKVVIRHDCAPYFTLTVTLLEVGGGTRLIWEQEFESAEVAMAVKARAGSANEENLDRLTRALEIKAGIP